MARRSPTPTASLLPAVTEREVVAASHTLTISRWRPALVNELVGVHWAKARKCKALDRDIVACCAVRDGVPRAAGRRLVSVHVAGPFRRRPDGDSVWKSLLDALVKAGLLVDDSLEWCELGGVTFSHQRGTYTTTITLREV